LSELKLRFRVGVEVSDGAVVLRLTPNVDGVDQESFGVPFDAAAARSVSSHMLGAAAKVDPIGHDLVLAQIREMFGLQVELLSMPAGSMLEH
jgi:hypothetical protein